MSPERIDYYGTLVIGIVKICLYLIALCGGWFLPIWLCLCIAVVAYCLEWHNDGRWFTWATQPMIACRKCGGSGFSGYGTGYDDVCDHCDGTQYELY